MLVHSYARFSEPKQEGGDSLRRQRESAKAFCERRGWHLSDLTFSDPGRSGWRGNKQRALTAFLAAIESGQVKPGETLLVEAVDRLSRKGVRATQTLVNGILNAGINIAIIAPVEKVYEASDSNDIGGAIELAAFAFQASVYSENLSHRVKAVNEQARRDLRAGRRKTISGVIPAWLEWNAGKQRFDKRPEAVKAVQFIFRRTIEGQGRKQLLKELNAKFPPISKRKNSHSWNETLVGQIIKGRSVLGELKSSTGETFEGYYPAIIDETTWKRANVEAAKRRMERGPQTESCNLFNGLLFHAVDGCTMGFYQYQKRDAKGEVTKYRRYKSYSHTHGKVGASTATVDVDRFEDLIFRFLPTLELSKSKRSEFDLLSDERAYLQTEIESLQQQIADRSESVAVLGPVLSSLGSQLADIERRIASTERKAIQPTKAYRDRLVKMRRGTVEERRKVREAIRAIVKRVELLPIKLGPIRRDPVRCLVEVHFRNGEIVRAVELPEGRLVKVTSPKAVQTLSQQIKGGWVFGADQYRKLISLVRR